MDDIDTEFTDDIICPWCGHKHRDYLEFDEGDHWCESCDKVFHLSIHRTVCYTTKIKT